MVMIMYMDLLKILRITTKSNSLVNEKIEGIDGLNSHWAHNRNALCWRCNSSVSATDLSLQKFAGTDLSI